MAATMFIAASAVVVGLTPAFEAQAAPTNGDIVFGRCWTSYPACHLYVTDADGADPRMLTDVIGTDPVVSPDGSQILFTNVTGRALDQTVAVVDADGTDRRLLAGGAQAAWSPDGTQIVYNAKGSRAGDLMVMDADGSHKVNITPSATAEGRDPTWSPDGERIVYVGTPATDTGNDPPPFGLVSIEPDGGSSTLILDAAAPPSGLPFLSISDPDFAPDGTHLVFRASPEHDGCNCQTGDLHSFDLASAEVTPLTATADIVETSPSYAPDGTRIAYEALHDDGRPSEIWTIGATGEAPSRVLAPFTSYLDSTPSWSAARHAPPPADPPLSFPTVLPVAVGGDKVPVPGDFDGDGDTDILWHGPGPGPDEVWRSNGDGTFTPAIVAGMQGTFQPFAGDFDGDGRDDIFWYRPGAATDALWQVEGFDREALLYRRVPARAGRHFTPAVGDFDGDGDDDILWDERGRASDRLWWSDDQHFGEFSAAQALVGDRFRPETGDFDGDGDDDVFLHGPRFVPSRTWEFIADDRLHPRVHVLGDMPNRASSTQRLSGDFDADGRGDLYFVQGDSRYTDSVRTGRSTTEFVTHGWQVDWTTFDRPFAGDFDGNGADDVFWYQTGPGADELWLFANPED